MLDVWELNISQHISLLSTIGETFNCSKQGADCGWLPREANDIIPCNEPGIIG